MQLHKILQYNIFKLAHILFFRIVYIIKLSFRALYLRVSKSQLKTATGCPNEDITVRYQRAASSLFTYYGFVSENKDIAIEEANLILEGKTRLFGQVYSFNPKTDWLIDVKTGKYWPRDLYWPKAKFVESGHADVKFVLEINKLNDLVLLAQAYYHSKDVQYLERLDLYLDGWLSCVPQEKSVAYKIAMDLGFRIINLIHISLLSWDCDFYRINIHPKILGIVKHHVGHLWENLSSRWFKSGNDNNHNIGEIVGLYVGQMWLKQFGIVFFTKRQITKELSYLQRVTERMISKNGCYLEQSANYTRVVHDFFLMFELFRHALDYNRDFAWFDKSGYFEKLSNYLLDISYHGQLPNFGDNDFARVVIPFEDKNDVVSHVRKHCQDKRVVGDYTVDGQWLYHSKDNNDVFLFSRVGKFSQFVEGAFIHAHDDLLAVLFFAKGKQIFIDKGTLFYNSGADTRREYTSTGAHNTAQIGNEEMADFLPVGYSNYPKSSLIESIREDDYCKFVGDVTYKDICHKRTITYSDNEIIIQDDLTRKSSLQEEAGTIRFVLAEDLKAEKDNDGILLKNSLGEAICYIGFEGVTSCNVKETYFAPHYALKKKTCFIEAMFEMTLSKNILTHVKIA